MKNTPIPPNFNKDENASEDAPCQPPIAEIHDILFVGLGEQVTVEVPYAPMGHYLERENCDLDTSGELFVPNDSDVHQESNDEQQSRTSLESEEGLAEADRNNSDTVDIELQMMGLSSNTSHDLSTTSTDYYADEEDNASIIV